MQNPVKHRQGVKQFSRVSTATNLGRSSGIHDVTKGRKKVREPLQDDFGGFCGFELAR